MSRHVSRKGQHQEQPQDEPQKIKKMGKCNSKKFILRYKIAKKNHLRRSFFFTKKISSMALKQEI